MSFTALPPRTVNAITAPVYGFYAGNDARIGATIPATTEAMKAAGKKYEPVTYDGAGHGFMRAGEDPTNTVPGKQDRARARLCPPSPAPSTDVNTKGNKMAKVVSVEARTVHIPLRVATAFARRKVTLRDYSLVKIRTDDGIEEMGHCYAGHSGGNVVTTAVREMLAPMLIGVDPYATELHWKNMIRKCCCTAASARSCGRSASLIPRYGTEMPGRPICPYTNISAPHTKTPFAAYASGGYYLDGKTAEIAGEEIRGKVALGLDAVKMKIGRGDLRSKKRQGSQRRARPLVRTCCSCWTPTTPGPTYRPPCALWSVTRPMTPTG